MSDLRFPVLFATDSGYIPHLATAIYSLLENNCKLKLRLVVFTGGILYQDKKNIANIAAKFSVPVQFITLADDNFDGLVLNHHFKKSNYYRLFAAEMISEPKCLYLDADLIVTGSVEKLINLNIEKYYLAAVEDTGFTRHSELGMSPDSKYFNSGMMLINLNKWREDYVKSRVISLVRSKPEAIRFVDQCGLNAIVNGNWVEADSDFNFQHYMLNDKYKDNFVSPVVVHFTGSSKPWHLSNKHPYKSLYWKYRNRTCYKKYITDDLYLMNIIRMATPKHLLPTIKYFKNKLFRN